ncbi:MAG: tetratricopeptide repeat protein [Planctomycetota bacterium]
MSPDRFEHEVHDVLAGLDDAVARGAFDEARDRLSNCLERARGFGDALAPRRHAEIAHALGRVERAGGDLEAAAEAFDEARRVDPSYKRAVIELVECRIRADRPLRPAEIEDYLDYAAFGRDARTLRAVHLRLRDALRIRLTDHPGEIARTMEHLTRLHRECPKINYPKQYLGRGHYLRRQYREAIEVLNSFTRDAAETAHLLNVIGRSHEKLGEFGAAGAAYERSLAQDPDQPGVLFRLGRIRLLEAQLD